MNEPLPWSSRQLLQTVWDMASATAASATAATPRWPTFAELDRRLDARHEIQALDVLQQVPPGLLYGVGPNSPLVIPDSQDIGLTVAGLQECQNTGEILNVFIEFIQIATGTEKGWEPPKSASPMHCLA